MAETTIMASEFDAACLAAREFNEYSPPERTRTAAACPSEAKGDRPGDEFNRRAAWGDILEPHGWTVARTAGDVTYWTRPGKAASAGISATTGRCKSDGGGDLLYVFSSNATPFEADTAYDKFGAVTHLEHAGDFGAAAKKLKAAGYSTADPVAVFNGLPPADEQPDSSVPPDQDFATNDDLKKFDLGLRWVWNNWLQVGSVNLLAAEGGAGKTRFVADLCRRVNSGLPWPDGQVAAPWENQYLAMWVAGDRNHGELLTLSEGFGFGERISYSGSKKDPLGGVTLQSAGDFLTLYKRVSAAKPLFLVVDTAGGSTGFNLAKQEEARSFFAPLSDMAVRLSLCVIVITHLNATKKVLGRRAEERVRCVIRMSTANKEPETPRRIEVVKSNSLFPKPIGMMLGATGNEYNDTPPPSPEDTASGGGTRADDGDPERGPATRCREVMDWLQSRLESAPLPAGKLVDEAMKLGFSRETIFKAKKALNIISSDVQGNKWWALAK